MIPFELPLKHGTDDNDSAIQAAPIVRVVVQPSSLQKEGEALLASVSGQVVGWVLSQRAAYRAGITQQYSTTGYPVPGIVATYTANQGTETIDIIVTPPGNQHRVLDLEAGDVWKIGTDDTSLPFYWNDSHQYNCNEACDALRRKPLTDNPPSLSGIYTKPLDGKVYWEVEITKVPGAVPEAYSKSLDAQETCEYSISPIRDYYSTRIEYKWPRDIATLLSPILGIVPQEWVTEEGKKADNNKWTTDYNVLAHVAPDNYDTAHRPITVARSSYGHGPTQSHLWSSASYDWYDDMGRGRVRAAGANPWQDFNPCVGPTGGAYGVAYFGDSIGVDGQRVYTCWLGAGDPGYWGDGRTPIWDNFHYKDSHDPLNGHYPPPGPQFTQAEFDRMESMGFIYFSFQWPVGESEWFRPDYVGDVKYLGPHGWSGPWDADAERLTLQYRAGKFVDSDPGRADYGDIYMPLGLGDKQKPGNHAFLIQGDYAGLPGSPDAYTPYEDADGSFWLGPDLGDLSEGDRVMFAVDTAKRKLWVGVNGQWHDGADPTKAATAHATLDGDDPNDSQAADPVDYYVACSVMVGECWVKLHLGPGKYPTPPGFKTPGTIDFEVPLD